MNREHGSLLWQLGWIGVECSRQTVAHLLMTSLSPSLSTALPSSSFAHSPELIWPTEPLQPCTSLSLASSRSWMLHLCQVHAYLPLGCLLDITTSGKPSLPPAPKLYQVSQVWTLWAVPAVILYPCNYLMVVWLQHQVASSTGAVCEEVAGMPPQDRVVWSSGHLATNSSCDSGTDPEIPLVAPVRRAGGTNPTAATTKRHLPFENRIHDVVSFLQVQ